MVNYLKVFVIVIIGSMLLFLSQGIAGDFEGKMVQRHVFVSLDAIGKANMNPSQVGNELFPKSVAELKQLVSERNPDDFNEQKMDIYVKGKLFRVNTEAKGNEVSMIYDMQNRKITTLQHSQKMAMVTSMDQMGSWGEKMGEAMGMTPGDMEDESEEDQFSMEAAGQTKTINGFKCNLYKGTDSDGDYTHLWLSEGHPDIFESFNTIFNEMSVDDSDKAGMDSEEKFFAEKNGIPILIKTVTSEDLNINEILEINKQSVSSDHFEVPDGYREMNMQQMMQQQMQKMQDQFQKQQ